MKISGQNYWADKTWLQRSATVIRWLSVVCIGLGVLLLVTGGRDPIAAVLVVFLGLGVLLLADILDWLQDRFGRRVD